MKTCLRGGNNINPFFIWALVTILWLVLAYLEAKKDTKIYESQVTYRVVLL